MIYIIAAGFVFAFMIFMAWVYLQNDRVIIDSTNLNLSRDGVELKPSIISEQTRKGWIELIKNKKYQQLKREMHSHPNINRIVKSISPQYVLQDYIWVIEKSAVHTCHRDNNGTLFNPEQKRDSYTMLVYLESMDKCLGVIKKSHIKKSMLLNGRVEDVMCSGGDAIIFNANLIHTGTINKRDDNLRVQLKITHKDDLKALSYYQNFNKVLNKENTNPKIIRQLQRITSCTFPVLSDMTQQENIKSARGTDEGATISVGQKWFSYLFYGRSDFYDLPNAF